MCQYKKKIVLFMDILGFKEIIEKKNPQEIAQILSSIKQILPLGKDLQTGYKMTQFSDSVILSFDIPEDKNIAGILCVLHSLLIVLVQSYDILLRGGMCIGEIYHEDPFVFGPAVNKAYKMESEEAKYPRIIVDKEIMDMFNDWNSKANPKKGESILEDYFAYDEDNKQYLKYLDHSTMDIYKNDLINRFNEKIGTNKSVVKKFKYVLKKLKTTPS